MSNVGVRYLFLPAFVALLQPIATNAAEHQRLILAESPDRPRFELRDRDWPGKVGEASVCLWKDDALAACSITIDDKIVLGLMDEMDDTRFDFPLTVKVRVAPSWKAVRAEQGGRAVEARVSTRPTKSRPWLQL